MKVNFFYFRFGRPRSYLNELNPHTQKIAIFKEEEKLQENTHKQKIAIFKDKNSKKV